jgi:nucleotide-binding universal stress UspA family protein
MYEKIVVPVDGSSTSDLGLSEAIKLARLTGARLVLLHAIDTVAVAAIPDAAAAAARLFEAMRESGEQILSRAGGMAANAGVAAESVLLDTLSGRVSDLVVEEARKRHADLIVMGTHGRRGVGRVLLGSDAEQVVRNASVPVLLVRGREGAGKPV